MKNMSVLKRFFSILLVSAWLLSGCQALGLAPAQSATPTAIPVTSQADAIIAEGHVVPRLNTNLYFSTQGQVSEVTVQEGARVHKGDVLARLGDREAAAAAVTAAELEQANAQRQSDDLKKNAALASGEAEADLAAAQQALYKAQQSLSDVDTQDHKTKTDDARNTINKAKDDLKTAQDDFDKVKDMDKDNANRKEAETKLNDAQKHYDQTVRDLNVLLNQMDQAQAQVNLAQARVEDATRTLNDRKNGPDPADQALADARLNNARAQLAAAQAALTRLDLVAPYDGTVVKVDLSAGETVTPNQVVMVFADTTVWYVDTSDLTENDVVLLKEGQVVSVALDALANVHMSGSVKSIGQTFVEKAGDITYVARIQLDDPDPHLRWGMTAKVTFAEK